MAARTYSRLLLAPDDAERAWDALYRAGALGGWEGQVAGEVVFIAVFADPDSARLARRFLAEDGIESGLEEDVVAPDPFAGHRATLSPFLVGRFRIDPRGEPAGGSEGPGTIWIPAYGAFGTGLHASTRGILEWIDREDLTGCRVLDVGCGSGILALAAARRGAASAVAFDRDADAVFEARRNFGRNRTRGAWLFAGEIGAIGGRFDVVFANMIWEESAPLVGAIAGLLEGGGTAVFSGILDDREEDAAIGISAAGLTVLAVDRDEEWRTIVARRP